MVKNHIKRIATPKSWNILRKEGVFMTRPLPGGHSQEYSLPASHVLKEMFPVASTTKEVKRVLCSGKVLVDLNSIKEVKRPIGLMDSVSFKGSNEGIRISLSEKGKLNAVNLPVEELAKKPVKIISKHMAKGGKIQIHGHDGSNLFVDKNEYNIGDTAIIDLKTKKISETLQLQKDAKVLLIGGKHVGNIGVVDEVGHSLITYSTEDKKQFQTSKKYALVIGVKDKDVVKVR